MKNHLSILEYADFAFVSAFFIIPPLFVPYAAQKPPGLSYSTFSVIFYILISIFLYLAVKYTNNYAYGKDTPSVEFSSAIRVSFFALCALAINTAILSFFAERFMSPQTSPVMEIPSDFTGFARLFVVTAIFASFEELLYRLYFPSRLEKIFTALFGTSKIKRAATCLVEVIPILCFGLSHRYLGFFPVINALTAGIIFRLTVKKTGTVWFACAVHTFYNMGILYLGSV